MNLQKVAGSLLMGKRLFKNSIMGRRGRFHRAMIVMDISVSNHSQPL
ncbi:Uncharacterised protein [Yersinia pseudotuberculosis]|nr:Uncharacterised protein [Yersinia pseudotuberculosis]